jgi:tetraacyldisaccharide 4'-kinase
MTTPDPTVRRAPLPGPVGRLASHAYGAAISRRNRAFDTGKGVARLRIPVISIGNLSVGGTGKTPMVMHLATALIGASVRPCIAMRGYRAKRGESDEAAEYTRRLPGTSVIARTDRLSALRELLASDRGRDLGVVLLDDGFQHRRIHRDLDIVLMDATHDPFADKLLPAGWLREPVESLARAHAAVVTHAESAGPRVGEEVLARAKRFNTGLVTAIARHAWDGLLISQGGVDRHAPPGALAGRMVVAACAIGNPGPFLAEAERQVGGRLAARFVRRDHDPFGPSTVRNLIAIARTAGAEFILTTEKDWSKLAAVRNSDWPCPVARPRLSLRFDFGEDALLAAVLAAVTRNPANGGRPD